MTKTAESEVRTLADEMDAYRANLVQARSRLEAATPVPDQDRRVALSEINGVLTRIDPAKYDSFDLRTTEQIYQDQRSAVMNASVLLSKTVVIHG